MSKNQEYLPTPRALLKPFKPLIATMLITVTGISFHVQAAEDERGGIIAGRYVPQRSATRPSIVPGPTIFVDTSPDDKIEKALSNNTLSSINELTENDFALITTGNPAANITTQIEVNGIDRNMSQRVTGAGIASNIMQSTSGVSSVLKGSSGAISNSLSRATSSIGQSITGATGLIK